MTDKLELAEQIGFDVTCRVDERMNDSVMIENMLKWAEEKIGNSEYAGWCLLER